MSERFNRIMQHQHNLMLQFRDIETKNGFDLPTCAVDIDSFRGQAELRRLAWCIQEELSEAAEQYHGDASLGEMRKEMIDALHFIAEFMLTLGYWPDDLPPESDVYPDTQWNGIIANLFHTMVELGLTVNCLKNKPWKQKARETDTMAFKERLARFIRSYMRTCYAIGMSDDDIEVTYFGKASENQERIDTGV